MGKSIAFTTKELEYLRGVLDEAGKSYALASYEPDYDPAEYAQERKTLAAIARKLERQTP